MTSQSQKINRSKDPFSVQPLPKSFYHPSPTKEVSDKEVIRSPQRHSTPATRCAELDDFLRRSPTFHTSALPHAKTLHDLDKSGPGLLKQGDVTNSSELDETWPDSERPSSVSATSVPEDTEAESPDVNVSDVVKDFRMLQHQSSTVDVMDNKISDKTSAVETGESVLQRYVERFRHSAPKSREERMREKSGKPQFWWLQPSSQRGHDSVDDNIGNNPKLDHLPESRYQSQKLTKDALLAMDEETFHLQSKADQLLSRSEFSLASSSPLVSTEGLGSSTSLSNSSVADGQLPYQPAYIQTQENYNRPSSRLLDKTEDKSRSMHTASRSVHTASRSVHTASRSPADDILTRWRLQRKVEEASTAVAGGQRGRLSSMKPSRNTELDVQLGEFRKKILSQKALVTQQDILYERQKLSLLMDDARQNGVIPNKDTAQAQHGVEVPARDIILEKLQRIIRSQDYQPAGTETFPQPVAVPSVAVSTGDLNFSINNANFVHSKFGRNVEHSLVDPALNRNNTALTNQRVLWDVSINDGGQPDVAVDSFGSQVVFDPKKKQFLLDNSGTDSDKSNSWSLIDDDAEELKSNEKKKGDAEVFGQKEVTFTSQFKNKEKIIRNEKPSHDVRSNKTDSSEASQKNSDVVEVLKEINMSSNDGKYVEKEHKQSDKRMNENLYQYLEAEKPISESRLDDQKITKTEKVIINGDKVVSIEEKSDEEKQYNLASKKMLKGIKETDEKEEAIDRREYARGQKKRKERRKHQITQVKDKDKVDTNDRDVLVDITNERNELIQESYSEISSVKGHSENLISYGKKDGKDSLGKPGKKTRPVVTSAASPGRYSLSQRPSPLARLPVHHAIGQAIADHLFDGSALASSVDSWASAFPQSPAALSHSISGSGSSTLSPSPSHRDSTPLESTRLQGTPDQQGGSDDEYTSDGEFHEDPLLQILRRQRDHFLQQLIYIEKKLQANET